MRPQTAGNSSIEYTFTQSADLSIPGSYLIESFTELENDAEEFNNGTSEPFPIIIVGTTTL